MGEGMVGYHNWSMGSFIVAGTFMMIAFGARADAIDGSWCYMGRHLAIEGPKMLTPGGKSISGEYDRHGFIYKAPSGEKEAGSMVYIVQLHEEAMEFRVGSEQAKPEVWKRCAAPTS